MKRIVPPMIRMVVITTMILGVLLSMIPSVVMGTSFPTNVSRNEMEDFIHNNVPMVSVKVGITTMIWCALLNMIPSVVRATSFPTNVSRNEMEDFIHETVPMVCVVVDTIGTTINIKMTVLASVSPHG